MSQNIKKVTSQNTIWQKVYDEAEEALRVVADLTVSDIQIGAVEIKNSDTDDRLKIYPDGSIDVNVSHTSDSVAVGDGTELAGISPANQLSVYGGNLIYNIDKTTTTDMVYIGMAAPGTLETADSWMILRIDKTASPQRIRRAGSSESFDKIWNNRVGLSYG